MQISGDDKKWKISDNYFVKNWRKVTAVYAILNFPDRLINRLGNARGIFKTEHFTSSEWRGGSG